MWAKPMKSVTERCVTSNLTLCHPLEENAPIIDDRYDRIKPSVEFDKIEKYTQKNSVRTQSKKETLRFVEKTGSNC